MAEPFKNAFNTHIIGGMAKHFKTQWPDFDDKGFYETASNNLDALELKERSNQIMNAMAEYLPKDFVKAGEVILASLSPAREGDIFGATVDDNGIAGWAIMPVADYVGLHGHDHFDLSMTLFKAITQRFSAEFGIRYFLLRSPDKTLTAMKQWTTHKDRHIRRLASEGSRPRLPWGVSLPAFIDNPLPLMPLLEQLRDDDEEYVRRSVANNLNDIAKDHPELVSTIAAQWMKGASKERQKLIKHGCRTLIKKGHKDTLAVFGFKPPVIKQASIVLAANQIDFGDALEFTLSLCSGADIDQPVIIDYIIHHQKANGLTSPKVFKWRTTKLPAHQTMTQTKKHAIRKITTRVYYPGAHKVEVVVNGLSVATADFQLVMPD